MLRLLTNLLTIVLIVLAGAQPAQAIANGEDAPDGDYAFAVRLTMTGIPTEDHGSRDSWCSGALIAPKWVITAGHCFRDADGKRVSRTVAAETTATVGRTDLGGSGGHQVRVVGARQAETADVALAELAEPITDVTPLTVGDTAPKPGERVRLTGYGLSGDGNSTPDRLQTGRFVVDRVGDAVLEISGRAPRRDTSACPHDSGGPYFRESPPVLVAVVSSGPTCPHEGPDLSARTDNLAGWITGTVNARPGLLSGLPARVAGGLALLFVLAVAIYLARAQRALSAAPPTPAVGGTAPGRDPLPFAALRVSGRGAVLVPIAPGSAWLPGSRADRRTLIAIGLGKTTPIGNALPAGAGTGRQRAVTPVSPRRCRRCRTPARRPATPPDSSAPRAAGSRCRPAA